MAADRMGNSAVPDLTHQVERDDMFCSAFGGFADVFRGTWRNEGAARKVAIKVLRHYTDEPEDIKERKRKKLRRELRVWRSLRHENILELYGTVSKFGIFPSMVCPWAEQGDLTKYLVTHHGTLKRADRLRILCEVAAGMSYLHDHNVVHGDLTGSNVLIDERGRCLLCDFGLSVVLEEFLGTSYLTSSVSGSVRWAAPELFTITAGGPLKITTESDVFSFGRVAYQTLAGHVPFHHIRADYQVIMELYRGQTPARPADVVDEQWSLIEACWSIDPGSRPTMQGCLRVLRDSTELVVDYYLKNILRLQFPFLDGDMRRFLKDSVSGLGENTRLSTSIRILVALHQVDVGHEQPTDQLHNLALKSPPTACEVLEEDNAMACLYMISGIVIAGGSGDWSPSLSGALKFVEGLLFGQRRCSPKDALLRCSDSTRFVAKLTMWLDLIEAISHGEVPYLYGVYRRLFAPEDTTVGVEALLVSPGVCMLSVVGCESHIFWAMSEVAWLAKWKSEQIAHKCLRITLIHQHSQRIGRVLEIPSRSSGTGWLLSWELTSEIFRHTARVCLYTVTYMPGPLAPSDVGLAIEDAAYCIRRAQDAQLVHSVVPRVVFGIFLCGCLSKHKRQRHFFRDVLTCEASHPSRTSHTAVKLMEEVWAQSQEDDIAYWRTVLARARILLI